MDFLKILEESIVVQSGPKTGLKTSARFLAMQTAKKIRDEIESKKTDVYQAIHYYLSPEYIKKIKKSLGLSSKEINDFLELISLNIGKAYPRNYVTQVLTGKNSWQDFTHDVDDQGFNILRKINKRKKIKESLNQFQKYSISHPNQKGHHQAKSRIEGTSSLERKSLSVVPKVRNRLKNPYLANAANNSQDGMRLLTPDDISELSTKYGIDFNDRRTKTIKGKTNMYVIPLPNGQWKMERR